MAFVNTASFILTFSILTVILILYETLSMFTIETNRLSMRRKVIAVYSENITKHINAMCAKSRVFFLITARGAHNYHRSLAGVKKNIDITQVLTI